MALMLSLLLLGSPYTAPAQDGDLQNAPQLIAVEKRLTSRQKELGIPGMALAIVKGDKVIYSRAFGFRDSANKLPVTPQTLFRIGSVTKTFTALMITVAADERRLSVSESPAKYLPYFRPSDDKRQPDVTIGQLLSHSAGWTPYAGDVAFLSGKLSRAELIQVLGNAKTVSKPGERYSYNNVAFGVLGEILAKAYGKPYEQIMQERIFGPVGMSSTTFSLSDFVTSENHSKGYSPRAPHGELKPRDHSLISAAGAMNSNLDDMAKFLRVLVNGGTIDWKRVVSKKALDELIEPRVRVDSIVRGAYGWQYVDFNSGLAAVGNTDGYQARIGFLPREKLGFVLLENVTDSPLKLEAELAIYEHLAPNAANWPKAPSPKEPPKHVTFKSPLTASELQRQVLEAEGGESRLKLSFEVSHENEGVGASGTLNYQGNAWSVSLRLLALGKELSKWDFDSSEEPSPYVRILQTHPGLTRADFGCASMLDASGLTIAWTDAKIVDKATIEGNEAYVVSKKSPIGTVTEFYSVKTHLLVGRQDAAGGMQTFSDHRMVRGTMVAFKRTSITSQGARSVLTVSSAMGDHALAKR